MEVVCVHWWDAKGVYGRLSLTEAASEGLTDMISAGVLIKEDSEVITLVQDYWTFNDRDGTTPEAVRELEVIPQVLVTGIERWQIKET